MATGGAIGAPVLAVFGAVYLGMALGRWSGLRLDRTGIALLGAIVRYGGGCAGWVILLGLMILSAQFAACFARFRWRHRAALRRRIVGPGAAARAGG